jgi:uncharacterized protein YcbX
MAPAAAESFSDIGLPVRRKRGQGAGKTHFAQRTHTVADPVTIKRLFRYPVKGLSAQELDHVRLETGETFPFDRTWAIENGPSRFDAGNPRHLPKIAFLMLMRDEKLATLQTEFDERTTTLTVSRGGKAVTRGDLSTKTGRIIVEQFLAAYLKDGVRGAPKILSAPDHSFTDSATKYVHIVNQATVTDLERVMGRPIDPLRFRPNIIVTGIEPWSEFGWLGQELRVGAGGVRLHVKKRVERCAATNVDPTTGARDADIPAVLQRQWGHTDFGVYAIVSERGRLAAGDSVTLTAHAA